MPTSKTATTILLVVAVVLAPLLSMLNPASAATTTAPSMKPNGDNSMSGWTGGGTSDGSCSGQYCSRIDEAAGSANTTDYLEAANDASYVMGIGDISVSDMQKATQITVRAYAAQSARGCITNLIGCLNYNDDDEIVLDANISGTWLGGQTNTGLNPGGTSNNANYGWLERSFTGNWTRSQIDAMTIFLGKWHADAKHDTIRVSTVEIIVTYQKASNMSQAVYRLYRNSSTAIPGTPYATTSTVPDIPLGTPFRLRTGVTVSGDEWVTGGLWEPHSNTYNLQYAARPNGGACGVFADVTSSTPIRWFNASPSSGNAIAALASSSDNVQGITASYQTYQEGNGFTNASQVNVGETALWDFSLVGDSSAASGSYCFRITRGDGTLTGITHTAYSEAAFTGSLSTGFVDAAMNEVATPSVPFANHTTSTGECGLVTAMLGTTSQRLRIENDLVTNGWNVSIAATAGPTTLWAAGSNRYDFNDPMLDGCGDNNDSDAYAGQLQVKPAAMTLTPYQTGCGTTGLSSGPDTKFDEGVTDAITLVSGSSSSVRFCHWDALSVGLEQRIPAKTSPGSYTIDMTVTITAQ